MTQQYIKLSNLLEGIDRINRDRTRKVTGSAKKLASSALSTMVDHAYKQAINSSGSEVFAIRSALKVALKARAGASSVRDKTRANNQVNKWKRRLSKVMRGSK